MWKTILGLCVVLLALWMLYPSRQEVASRPGEEVVEITFMGPGGPVTGALEDVVAEFEQQSREAHAKDPSRPIYRVISGQTAVRNLTADPTRFLVSMAGGAPPDVIFFDRYALAEWAARGAFVSLDGYIQQDLARKRPDTPCASRFYKAAWDEGCYKGKSYGIPVWIDDRALFYNKDLLKRAGLVDAKGEARPPQDWDELKEYAVKLTERDAKGRLKVVGFAPNFGNCWLYMYGWMAGAEFMSSDGRQCTLNHPKVVEGLTYMKEVYDSLGGFQQARAFEAGFQGDELDPFIQGKIAMKIDGAWVMPKLAAYGREMNFGIAPPPMPKREIAKGRTQMTWTGGFAYAIPVTARHKEAGWELIRFLTSRRAGKLQMESERALNESMGRIYLPTQNPEIELNQYAFETYVEKSAEVPQKFKDGYRVFNDLLPIARYRPVTPVGQLLWNEHVTAMEAALHGRLTPQKALDQGAANVQRILNRILNPTKGTPVRSWNFFFVVYGLILVVAGALVYQWDTRAGFRNRLARWLGIRKNADTVIEGSRGGFFRRQWIGGLVCVLPWIIGFILFSGGPMLFSLLLSFCNSDIVNPAVYTGLDNYRLMLGDDRLFGIAMTNTLFMVAGVPLGMAVSLGVALLLNQAIRGMAAWRTFFYLPAIVPMVAASILWIWVFNPNGGAMNLVLRPVLEVVNQMGEAMGMHWNLTPPLWLQSTVWSKPAIIIMGLWSAGSGMIIWLAGLKGIPQSLYEAAAVDGASPWRQFVHVTLPQLTPYIFFNLIMGLIQTFQIFGQAFVMTQGGPENSTLFYVYHLFNNAFRYGQMGYASAMAWVLFVIVLALTIFQLKISRKWVHYESE